jgi:glutaredoxin 3
MERSRAILLLWAALLLSSVPSAGEGKAYYRYSDGSGIHFVDALERVPAPLRSAARKVPMGATGAPRINRAEAAPVPETRPFSDVALASSSARVVIYTAPWCGWCRKSLAWLDAEGIAYENRDIDANPAHRQELLDKTGRTAIPVMEIDGALIRGYSPDRWAELL